RQRDRLAVGKCGRTACSEYTAHETAGSDDGPPGGLQDGERPRHRRTVQGASERVEPRTAAPRLTHHHAAAWSAIAFESAEHVSGVGDWLELDCFCRRRRHARRAAGGALNPRAYDGAAGRLGERQRVTAWPDCADDSDDSHDEQGG